MLENFTAKFKKVSQKEQVDKSKNAAKERLHLVLMQDRAHVSADFLDLMKQEIVDVIKKYIDVDEKEMDVKLENKVNEDGTSGAPALYANIPIVSINENMKKETQDLVKAKQSEESAPTEKKKTATEKAKKAAAEKKSLLRKSEEKGTKATAISRMKKDKEHAIVEEEQKVKRTRTVKKTAE